MEHENTSPCALSESMTMEKMVWASSLPDMRLATAIWTRESDSTTTELE